MDPTSAMWVALDCDKAKAIKIAQAVGGHPAVLGFKVNRLVDHEAVRPDDEPGLFRTLSETTSKPIWADLKLKDIPRTVAARVKEYADSGLVRFITVMADGEVEMMRAAVDAGFSTIKGRTIDIIAVTLLTSIATENAELITGHSAKATVISLARLAVLAHVDYLVCSGQELKVVGTQAELRSLKPFIPAIKPVWSLEAGYDQKRVTTPEEALKAGAEALVIGQAIVDADDPLEAVNRTADEIAAIT